MKIAKISAYRVLLPVRDGAYNFGDGKGGTEFDSTVVRIDTDAGFTGWGEVCPLGSNHLPAYAAGVRTGLRELGPQLLGDNPLELSCLNNRMDYLLRGHPYVKSAIDMACWDILGKATGLSVCTLMGGRHGEAVNTYRSLSQGTTEKVRESVLFYREQGYREFQVKVGLSFRDDITHIKTIRQALDPSDLLIADANTGWVKQDAMKVVNAVSDLDVYIEQPCDTYEECLSVRRHSNLPFILDESVHDVFSLVRAHSDAAADVVGMKLSKFGGLTKAKQARDLCVSLGMTMKIEDTWGSEIVTSAIVHLAHSTPERFRFSIFEPSSYNDIVVSSGVPTIDNATMKASTAPGLGIVPNMDVLGEPVLVI